MFRSTVRPHILTQFEHGRMSGILAAAWGNDAFDRPALDFRAWVEGVTFHDWHYGLLDNLPIGATEEQAWLAVTRIGVELELVESTADIVAKLHIRRLLGGDGSAHPQLVQKIDDHIQRRLSDVDAPLAAFQWADRITRFCDRLAFDFGFGTARAEPTPVYARQGSVQETGIQYRFGPHNEISVQPWPFSAPSLSDAVTVFEAEGYPERLQPHRVPFTVSRG